MQRATGGSRRCWQTSPWENPYSKRGSLLPRLTAKVSGSHEVLCSICHRGRDPLNELMLSFSQEYLALRLIERHYG